MPFKCYDTSETLHGETIRVRGSFNMSDPWWAARMAVTKHGDTWDMQGNAAYSLRDESAVVSDKVVPIFLTSCKVEPQHLEMFTEGLRYDHVYIYF